MQQPVEAAQQIAQQFTLLGIKLEGWLTILAIILGPIFAVQAQTYIDHRRQERQRKFRLFRELMATRGTRLSPRHVEALNLVELEYSASNPKQRPVFEAWRSYFDLLNTAPADPNNPQPIYDRRDDAFVDMLYEMSRFQGFSYDRVAIRRNSYLPTGHGEMEVDQVTIRKALVEILTHKKALSVFAGLFPGHPAIKVEVVDAANQPAPAAPSVPPPHAQPPQ